METAVLSATNGRCLLERLAANTQPPSAAQAWGWRKLSEPLISAPFEHLALTHRLNSPVMAMALATQ